MKVSRLQWIFMLCVALSAVSALCYLPITHHDFVNLDDKAYITENTHVTSGLSWANVGWALRSGYASNWHPLTWISHMADWQMHGPNAGGHHLTNLLFHSANTMLVFLFLVSFTGRIWPSAFVAAFFGCHPLHVESVAWASERKDVLSTFFWLLALLAYGRYANARTFSTKPETLRTASSQRAAGFYLLTLFLFALGLMSKAMVVTLPFVLLLLDWWPLERLVIEDFRDRPTNCIRLVLEKVPFFALSFAASVVTFLVQNRDGATSSLQAIPLYLRLENSVIAYCSYVGKTVWPAKLAPFYPYVDSPLAVTLAASVLFLVAVTVLCLRFCRRYPFLLVGWLWFLGTLVPVIGLVQVGAQSMADRYMYIPSIGLFVLMVWAAVELWEAAPRGRLLLITAGTIALIGCMAITRVQERYWQNGVTLARHGIEIDPHNYLAFASMASALDDAGDERGALAAAETSVGLEPNFTESQLNLGSLLAKRGDFEDAFAHFEIARKGNPKWANAAHALGNTYFKLGQMNNAAEQLKAAIRLDPQDADAHADFGTVLLHQDKLPEAERELSAAIRLNPALDQAQLNLGVALARQDRPLEAVPHFQKAVAMAPENSEARFNLGLSLLDSKQWAPAAAQFAAGERLRPKEARFPYRRAVALSHLHRTSEAISEYRKAIQLYPDFPDALNELAWILATSPDAKLRSGTEAVLLAEKACDLTHRKEAKELTTLAAAYAESGRFGEAVQAAKTAADLARKEGQQKFALQADQWAQAYQSGRPARETL